MFQAYRQDRNRCRRAKEREREKKKKRFSFASHQQAMTRLCWLLMEREQTYKDIIYSFEHLL